jgi:ribonuclease E
MIFDSFMRNKNKKNSSKRMIINVVNPEESRVAITENEQLTNLAIETTSSEKIRGNIYKGVVKKVQRSLNAAFVEFGSKRHGFLPLDEVHAKYHTKETKKVKDKPSPDKILKKNQEILVQITKEEKDNKGAALTTYISLPGRYLVIMPGYKRSGISKKIDSAEERKKLKDIGKELKLPDTMGFIIRTAGLNKTKKDLQKDADYLLRLYKAIESKAENIAVPTMVYQESNMVIQSIRDYFTTDIGEVLIDSPEAFKKATDFFKQIIPKHYKTLTLYEEKEPVFSKYKIEKQIEALYERTVPLKSGGSISIDPTEALVAIDVNTARFTRLKTQEETTLITNLEAAEEIARQLRLRDLGGLIVIDFIDMKQGKDRQQVERHLKNAFKTDKANIELSRISKFGMLEMSRERLRSPLLDMNHITCPFCKGSGKTRATESLSLLIMKKLFDGASSGENSEIKVSLSPEVAEYLLNVKRAELLSIENQFNVKICISSADMNPADSHNIELIAKG